MDENTPDVIQGTEPVTDVTDVIGVTQGVTQPVAEPVVPDPDAPGETPEPIPPKPSGVEKRISELVWKAKEAERREAEATRRAAYFEGLAQGGRGAPQGAQQQPKDGPPTQEQFATYDEYLRALTRHEINAEMAQERRRLTAELEAREVRGTFESRAKAAREKHTDFDQVVFNDALHISETMRDAIFNLEDGAEIAYHLGQNPEEASRIARLHPDHQKFELGRLSVRIAAPPPAPPRPASAAPAPITPVRAVAKANEGLRDDLPIEEWMRRREKQVRSRG